MPCPDCARAIIQSGIKTVVTYKLEPAPDQPTGTWRDKVVYSEQMFKEAGVTCIYL
jgi:deoxycytidylate deaminase